jgi:hypothetical protein
MHPQPQLLKKGVWLSAQGGEVGHWVGSREMKCTVGSSTGGQVAGPLSMQPHPQAFWNPRCSSPHTSNEAAQTCTSLLL